MIANAQVVFVAAAAWVLYGERPTIARIATILIVLGGVVLTSGLARHDAYGARPVAGAVIGLLAARQSTRPSSWSIAPRTARRARARVR